MPRNRGKWEAKWLNQWEREQRENLPAGVGLEYSPLLDLKERPWLLIGHLLRYYFVSSRLMHYLQESFEPSLLNILDVGCGYGEMVNFLNGIRLPPGYQRSYMGIDADPNRIRRARVAFPKSNFAQILLPEGLEALTETYQGFICTEVIEHLELEQGKKLLRTLRNMAAPRAIAIFTVPAPEVGMRRDNPLHQHEYGAQQFLEVARESGWAVLDWCWLKIRATELPPKNEYIPYDLYQPLVSPTIGNPNVRGSDALYVLGVDNAS